MVKTVLIVLAVLIASVEGAEIKWIAPKEKVCKKHGGKYDSKTKLCNVLEEMVVSVCQKSGGGVPTYSDLIKLVEECGGEAVYFDGGKSTLTKMEKNEKNETYQNCYQRQGFKSKTAYWSATPHYSVNDSLLRFWSVRLV